MKLDIKRIISLTLVIFTFVFYGLVQGKKVFSAFDSDNQTKFDQAAALAKLREQIKGRETEPAEKVFKNIQMLKNVPAGRLLAIMEMGYARSLGVDCTHCHIADKWESEEKTTKQVTRDMAGMVRTINTDLLKNIKNLNSEQPVINCTTCHRGQVKPALNLPVPSPSQPSVQQPSPSPVKSPSKS